MPRCGAPAAGCRSTASWRWRSMRRASATTPTTAASSAACRSPAAISSPRPKCRRCSAARWRCRWPRRWRAAGTREVCEFGAGTGALALQLLDALGDRIDRYRIVELSGQPARAPAGEPGAHARQVEWLDDCPAAMRGVVVGNEVLDAMPVKLLVRSAGRMARARRGRRAARASAWADRPDRRCGRRSRSRAITTTSPRSIRRPRPSSPRLADRLQRGVAFLIDYGFPEAEYYHPQRLVGTLMCHRGHRADGDPLVEVGDKDITAHVNFSGIALAGQEAGLAVLGYCSQARFLLNCGIVRCWPRPRWPSARAREAGQRARDGRAVQGDRLRGRRAVGCDGFSQGDRTHTL